MIRYLFCSGVSLLISLTFATTCAWTQGYPTKPLRMIVPFPPGGGADVAARVIVSKLSDNVGQPVVVENKPGASTIIGTDLLSKAPPDGYTFGMLTDAFTINESLYEKLPYDSRRGFEPISQLVVAPLLLVTHPSLQARTLAELIAVAKTQPGRINYASVGVGTPHYLAMEWLKVRTGIDLVHVPYQGTMVAYGDLLNGRLGAMFTGLPTGMPNVLSGKLVAIAVTTPKRQPSAVEVPTMIESGLPDFELVGWYGAAAPGGTSKDIVSRLSQAISRVLDDKGVQERLGAIGLEGSASSPESFKTFLDGNFAKYAHIIKVTGTKIR